MSFGASPGARDGDPISLMILMFMGIILLLWLGNSSFTPWQGDYGCSGTPSPNCHTVIASGFNNAFNTLNNSGFLTLFVPLGIVMFLFYIYREFGGEDVAESYDTRILGRPRIQFRQPKKQEEEEPDQEETEAGEEKVKVTKVQKKKKEDRKYIKEQEKRRAEQRKAIEKFQKDAEKRRELARKLDERKKAVEDFQADVERRRAEQAKKDAEKK